LLRGQPALWGVDAQKVGARRRIAAIQQLPDCREILGGLVQGYASIPAAASASSRSP
jgi:hypothetical protein